MVCCGAQPGWVVSVSMLPLTEAGGGRQGRRRSQCRDGSRSPAPVMATGCWIPWKAQATIWNTAQKFLSRERGEASTYWLPATTGHSFSPKIITSPTFRAIYAWIPSRFLGCLPLCQLRSFRWRETDTEVKQGPQVANHVKLIRTHTKLITATGGGVRGVILNTSKQNKGQYIFIMIDNPVILYTKSPFLETVRSRFTSACCCWSITKLCPMDCSMPGFPVLHYLLDFAQIRVHWYLAISFCASLFSFCLQSFPTWDPSRVSMKPK